MKLSLILAAGMLAIGGVAAVPAEAQHRHDGPGFHDGRGPDSPGFHGDRGRGGHGFRGDRHDRGGPGYGRWHGGHRGRLVCRYRHGSRRCFRV